MNDLMRNPGREGGPKGYMHTTRGVVPVGDDGFPIEDEQPVLDVEQQPRAVDRYPVVDIGPVTVEEIELP
ncbi:hypothetical protein ACFROC_05380 [Nocardia tengchongensis]|uniref:hypothetical protein n=1 Tax=Nocardia tengchongensis TaxID=2055889 RepID=UPI003682EDEF